ncbi:hypothetical protein Pcinc_011308 [Petrolisthes cinctipes]|uniref:Uncharacterized protein n=1 Tax=Petrolisthes cinctipes TaxID=88211 RepID=A0AAE1G324_PETCI|nr:hypothetical protein Pcinc_011308 [Petrolisthes cinctipes]
MNLEIHQETLEVAAHLVMRVCGSGVVTDGGVGVAGSLASIAAPEEMHQGQPRPRLHQWRRRWRWWRRQQRRGVQAASHGRRSSSVAVVVVVMEVVKAAWCLKMP